MAEKGSVALGDLFVGSKDELYVPFVVGNVSVHLGSEAVEHSKTHEWLVYVRGLENEDLSWIVKKVQFTLHESFEKPVREIIKPPFEVAESGWGEFEVKVKVFFRDNIAKPIEFTHYLALYHLSPEKDPKSPVISETYDEFVFPNPSEVVKQLFERGVKNRTVFADHPHMKLFIESNLELASHEERLLRKLMSAHQRVLRDLHQLRMRMDSANSTVSKLTNKMASKSSSFRREKD